MKTFLPKKNDLKNEWFLIDAAEQVPGKVATEAARRLTGKHRPDFTPHLDLGDGVVIINASKIRMTGKKLTDKLYRTHSGYKGHLKSTPAGKMLAEKPTRLIELAVKGMLPKNKLRDARLTRLKVYATAEHPHAAQKPVELTIS